MPSDEATQWSLGLFHGLPQWWRKKFTSPHSPQIVESSGAQQAAVDRSYREEFYSPVAQELGNGGHVGRLDSLSRRRGALQGGTYDGLRMQRDLVPFAWGTRVRRGAFHGLGLTGRAGTGLENSSIW